MASASFSRPISFMIWWAILVHLAWGIALIVDPGVLPIGILVGLHWLAALGLNGLLLGLMLIVAASVAAVGLMLGHRVPNYASLLMLMPQYALLIASFISDAQSCISGSVDGRDVDRIVLFVALWPIMVAAMLHSLAIIERHLNWNRI